MTELVPFSCKMLTDELLNESFDFLLAHEEQCVSLVSKLIDNDKIRMPINNETCYVTCDEKRKQINGFILITKSGLLLHCFDLTEASKYHKDEQAFIFQDLSIQLNKKKLYCIMGEQEGTKLIQLLYNKEIIENREYHLMVHSGQKNPLKALPEKYKIIKCNIHDADSLYTLQEIYDKAEILPLNEVFEPLRCKSNLLLQLKTMTIFGIKREDEFIAKAGINAQGINWVQIGGVCTHPDYRCKQLAQHLVSQIIQFANIQKKQIVLFVNKQNIPAINAYKKQGFIFLKSFNIVYF